MFGAEFSFAIQNTETYRFDESGESLSLFNKYLLALLICSKIVKRFINTEPPISDQELSMEFGAPIRLIKQQLYKLKNAGIISEIMQENNEEPAYQPAMEAKKMTVAHVINALEHIGEGKLPVVKSSELEKLKSSLVSFQQSIDDSDGNFLLQDL